MTREIYLTRGLVTLLDNDDYESMRHWTWYASNSSKHPYAIRRLSQPPRPIIVMHRVIMNAPDDAVVDHINGDSLDNRRCNLRICTTQENVRNRRTRAASSGFKGVSLHSQSRLWRAAIHIDAKQITLGYFKDAVDAAHAYDDAAREYFGSFARLNFPRDGEQAA